MTPEERAIEYMIAEGCGCTLWPDTERVFCCDPRLPDDVRQKEADCGCKLVATFIRTAENEALERAAVCCELYHPAIRVAATIRSLKSTPPQADGEQG